MKRIAIALATACILTLGAQAQFQPPSHLPRPVPGHPNLPTPHLPPLPVTYNLFCTLGTSVLAPGKDVWHVNNPGTYTVPAGAHLRVQFGFVLADDYVLDRAMPPGDGWDFVSGHLRSYGARTGHEVCAAEARSG